MTDDSHLRDTDLEDAQEHAESGEEGEQRRNWGTSGLTPSEAAKLRWEKQRARKAEHAGGIEDTRLVQVPVRVSKIIGALEKKAAQGDVQGARELRSWLTDYPPSSGDIDPEALPRELRKALYARLLAEEGHEIPA